MYECSLTFMAEPPFPKIVDVKAYNDTAVIVTFSDGTQEKAVLQPPDVFSLEHGISVCLTKRLLRRYTDVGKEGGLYNRLVRSGMKVYAKKQNEALRRMEDETRKAEARLSREQRAKEKRDAARQKEMDEAVRIQKDAYLQAIRELSKESRTDGGFSDEDH